MKCGDLLTFATSEFALVAVDGEIFLHLDDEVRIT
jgi:hypothetical protein